MQKTSTEPHRENKTGGPLNGVRVVEFGHWMAGPLAGGLLCDWGADVIKVEPPGGEPMRTIFARMGARDGTPNAAFTLANRGKRSVVIDIKAPQGRQAFETLLQGSDVLLTNLKPDALERLGLSPDAVRNRHGHLVYCTVSAYGWGGPDQDRPGYDIAAFFGRTGIAHEITTEGTAPPALLQGIGDAFTALSAATGILATLLERQKTGHGRFVEASLLRTGMWALGSELGQQALGGHPRPPRPREQSRTPMYNSYCTADKRWFFLVGVEARRHLPNVLQAIGREDLIGDVRFQSPRSIAAHSSELIRLLDKAFGGQTLSYWKDRFDEHQVWWAPVQTPEEVLTDPQAAAIGAWVEVDGEKSVDNPLRFDLARRSRAPGAPATGAHTAEVLAEFGLPEETIQQLLAQAVSKEGEA
ncbi:CaiB/BaiF CoA transferase family protein [Candidimonas nitroreducens]|nr:CaiB/BaiF CoA-transferase family protein [Candidimonas nitroreducens]